MSALKKMYLIFHCYTTDGGFGDAIPQEEFLTAVYATPDEIEEFVDTYDKPYIYDKPYADLFCHEVRVEEVDQVCDISQLNIDWLEDQLHSPDWKWDWEDDDDEFDDFLK